MEIDGDFDPIDQEMILSAERDLAIEEVEVLRQEIQERLTTHSNIVKNCEKLQEVLHQRKENLKAHYASLIQQYKLMRLILEH